MSHKRNVIMFEWLANGLEKQITFFYFIWLWIKHDHTDMFQHKLSRYHMTFLNKKVLGNKQQHFLFTMNVELDTIVKEPFLGIHVVMMN